MSIADTDLGELDLRDALWPLEAAPAGAASRRCLQCEIGDGRFAVPIEYLRGVEPYAAVTPLPQLPAWVVGVTNVRGTVVGVVDLARFLALGETIPGHGRLLICGAAGRQVALAVGAARSVLDYPPSALLEAAGVSGRVGRYVAALVPTDETAVPLLDLGRLLADDELVRG